MDESAKQMIDVMSVGTMLGALGSMLPPVAALFTIIWTGIRIWETETVQGPVSYTHLTLPTKRIV